MKLDFGRYQIDYTRNGKYLLMGSNRGHIAMLDWRNKNIQCEFHVKDKIRDIKFLHSENMFAVRFLIL